jgi:ABC-type multidrug transport system ATPase subunit
MIAVSADSLSKSYGNVRAVESVSFEAQRSELFGIIGADGAGKTTLFRLLVTLLVPTSGTAIVDGYDIVKQIGQIRKRIGYMPGRFSLYQDLTVEENLRIFATVFGTTVKDNYYLVKDIYQHLEPFKNRRAGKLSGGMKQKLALCCALIHKPTVLFLDEPTTGVDPVSRKEFWEMLKRLKNQGISILVSTPYMDEAGMCDRIAFMQNGRFLKIDTPVNIIRGFTKPLWAVRGERMSQLLSDLRKIPGVKTCFAFGDTHHVTVDKNILSENDLIEALVGQGHSGVEVAAIEAGIEDCFMDISNRS